jgi:hypothetical protein
VAAKVATSASVAVGAMNNCQNCVYVRRVCACMGRERCLYGYGQSRGEQRRSSRSLCLVFAARPRVRVFAPRRLMRWLPLASLPGASLPSTSRLPTCHKPSTMRCWSVCESVAPCTHPHRHGPPFFTSPFHFASPQHKRTLRFPHAQVLERIKQGYQYLLPSICVEIFSKEGAAAGEKPYGVVSCSRGIRRCILRACNS